MTPSKEPIDAIPEGPELAIARVAYDVVRSVATSFGDYYANPPWEVLERAEQDAFLQRVTTYLATPAMRPIFIGANPDQQTRAKEYALHGVVRAIAQEQTRT
jgi:hypothetical protein